jgi:uncharacterized membrane protein YhaH (DUF805 family)
MNFREIYWTGRPLKRTKFLVGSMGLWIVMALSFGIYSLIRRLHPEIDDGIMYLCAAPIAILFLFYGLTLLLRRLVDIGLSSWNTGGLLGYALVCFAGYFRSTGHPLVVQGLWAVCYALLLSAPTGWVTRKQ